MKTSHPAGVSIGEPQLPSWTSSHGRAGAWIVTAGPQRCRSSEYAIALLSLSQRDSAAYRPPMRRGKSAMPLLLVDGPGELGDGERPEVRGLQQVRCDAPAIERRVRRVVGLVFAVDEAHEPRVFHAVALGRAAGPENSLGESVLLIELDLIVGRRHPAHPVDERRGVSARRLLPGQLADGGVKLGHAEAGGRQAPEELRVLVLMAEFGEFLLEQVAIVVHGA